MLLVFLNDRVETHSYKCGLRNLSSVGNVFERLRLRRFDVHDLLDFGHPTDCHIGRHLCLGDRHRQMLCLTVYWGL
jgi:hypothetical protein